MSRQADVSDERMNHMRAMEAASSDHEIKQYRRSRRSLFKLDH